MSEGRQGKLRDRNGARPPLKREGRPSVAALNFSPHPGRRLPFTQPLYSQGLINKIIQSLLCASCRNPIYISIITKEDLLRGVEGRHKFKETLQIVRQFQGSPGLKLLTCLNSQSRGSVYLTLPGWDYIKVLEFKVV